MNLRRVFQTETWPVPMIGGRPLPGWALALLTLAMLGVLAFVYLRPVSISGEFLNDSFVFFDGIHRVAQGQVPHVDFSTPVGALGYWLPYLGFELIGGYPGAVETASLLLAAIVVPVTAVLLLGRASIAMAILILGIVAGVLVVPLVPGWPAKEISHAMHYNRWGWGLIVALFMLGLPPPAARNDSVLRGVLGGFLAAALFLIKITYFLPGMAFLVLLLVCPDARRRAGLVALVVSALLLIAVWVATGGMFAAYLGDIREAIEADSVIRDNFLVTVSANRYDVFVVALAFYAGLLRRRLRWYDLMLAGFVCAAGIAILDQNFQFRFIVCLPAALALLAMPRADDTEAEGVANSLIAGLGYVLVLPFLFAWVSVTVAHLRSPQAAFESAGLPGFETLYLGAQVKYDPDRLSPPAVQADATQYLRGDVPVTQLEKFEYIIALRDGFRLLSEAGLEDATIFTFDWSNVFPHLLDAPRVPGGYSWYHLGRNVSLETLPDAETMFRGYDYVVLPMRSYQAEDAGPMMAHFADYLIANFREIGRSENWILMRRSEG